jgi:hypothetical protein
LHTHKINDNLLLQQPAQQVNAASKTLSTIQGQYLLAEQCQGSGGHKLATPQLPPQTKVGFVVNQMVFLKGFSQRTSVFPCQYHFTNVRNH